MAFHSFVAGERPTAAQWNDWVGRRVIADCTSSTRPSSPVEGEVIYETDTDRFVAYDGTGWFQVGRFGSWDTYTPTWTSTGTPPALNNGSIAGYYQRLFNKTFALYVKLVAGSTTTFGTGSYSLSIPSGFTMAREFPTSSGALLDSSASTYYALSASAAIGGSAIFLQYGAIAASLVTLTSMSATAPVTLATADTIWIGALVEVQ